MAAEGEYAVDQGDLVFGQTEAGGSRIFGCMLGVRGFRNSKKQGSPHQESKRDLANGGMVRVGDLLQNATTGCTRAGKGPVAEGAVGDHGDMMFLTPGNYGAIDGTLLQVIQDLVACKVVFSSDLKNRLQLGHIEVADAPRKDLPITFKLLERRDRIFQGMIAGPVQEIAIQPVRS